MALESNIGSHNWLSRDVYEKVIQKEDEEIFRTKKAYEALLHRL